MKKKIKLHEIRKARVFKALAFVLGKRRAARELRKVAKTKGTLWDEESFSFENVRSCFVWAWTPQGFEYWHEVEGLIQTHYRKHKGKYL